MAMTAMSAGASGDDARRGVSGDNALARRAARDDTSWCAVAAALAHESSLRLAESVRTFASQSRARGDSINEVLEVLMDLVRETTPQNASSAKRSCDVAEWAIAGYFEGEERRGRGAETVRTEEDGVRRP